MNKYSIIYADPPWTYKDKANAGNRGACHKYDLMTDADLQAMRPMIDDIAAKDCALFMWATFPKLQEGLDLIKAWGFEYKTTVFVWNKFTEKGKPAFGMGRWTRSGAEIVLLGTRGSPKRKCAGISQVSFFKMREHSRKPDEIADQIVTLMGDIPRIELFARTQREGWGSFGNQVAKFAPQPKQEVLL